MRSATGGTSIKFATVNATKIIKPIKCLQVQNQDAKQDSEYIRKEEKQ